MLNQDIKDFFEGLKTFSIFLLILLSAIPVFFLLGHFLPDPCVTGFIDCGANANKMIDVRFLDGFIWWLHITVAIILIGGLCVMITYLGRESRECKKMPKMNYKKLN